MSKEYRTKVFRSGNSVAVRLPKGLGMIEGENLVLLSHSDGSLSVRKESARLAQLMSLFGSMSPGYMADGRGDIEQAERDWSVDDSGSRAS